MFVYAGNEYVGPRLYGVGRQARVKAQVCTPGSVDGQGNTVVMRYPGNCRHV